MKVIPPQLQDLQFRFALVNRGTKTPAENYWTTLNNYPYDHPKLQRWIAGGGNYGVLCGYGNLAVIDADHPLVSKVMDELFGEAFRVRSGSGRGFHDYLIVRSLERKILLKKETKHYGDVQWAGQMVVGPGSLHPCGGIYEVVRDLPIPTVEAKDLLAAFKDFIRPTIVTDYVPKTYSGKATDLQSIPLTAILHDFKGRWTGKWMHGKNPWHGARSGFNFSLSTTENYWHCHHCGCSGGVARAIALNEGIIHDCADTLTRDQFLAVLKIAREKYGLIDGKT